MDIRATHRQAVQLAKQANEALEARFMQEYEVLTEQALILERQAAFALINEWDAEPTRSVLFRSAATLAKNLQKYDEARQLIHLALSGKPYFEIEQELKTMLTDVDLSVAMLRGNRHTYENEYMNFLREVAINAKVEAKDDRYAKAVAVDSIIDFLRSVQRSFSGYAEVNYRKEFPETDNSDYDKKLNAFKQDNKALCVDLQFNSFGVSIAADTKLQNYRNIYSDKFTDFKASLFTSFKKEVVYADITSEQVREQIIAKYSLEERVQIYSPIVEPFRERSAYKVTYTDKFFQETLKQYKVIDRGTELFFKAPPKEVSPEAQASLQRTVDLVRGTGKKRILTENLNYAKFTWPIINQLEFDTKIIYFRFPYDITIVFNEGQFWINDEFYQIAIVDKDYQNIQRLYTKSLVEKYSELLSKSQDDSLTDDERKLLEYMKNNITKGW